ncbi:MAG: glycoside hydrolase TIM-barrel-like domain-containing protein [Roseiarcus sp.]|jgi:hypothetical protein
MASLLGVHLLPATGEFTYDTIAHQGAVAGGALQPLNTFFAPEGARTDCAYALDQLQAAHPECSTVSLVCAWFADSLDAASCRVYPATNFIGGSFAQSSGASWIADDWRVSGLTQNSRGLIALPTLAGGGAVYGGTPSDASVVRCIRDLKARGYKVVFYPFLLMTAAGFPWRGLITHTPDLTSAASSAVAAFLGAASPAQFTPDPVNLTVAYSGAPADYTYRRMILHYAWLTALADGVDLFLIGSELRTLETIRGPAWTKAGSLDASGHAAWDYPFVAGLAALASDVRSIFDGESLTRGAGTANLIAYSADWSSWMGWQHAGENGQWPHLDALWASPAIDRVGFDNYLPLSDWTTGDGGLDATNWLRPAPAGAWPPSAAAMNGLGLVGAPTIHSLDYFKANIEGGEKFNWWYADGDNVGAGLDPNGSDLIVSLPEGDRLAQTRRAYSANQQALANKQLRWWWNNPHQAIYDAADGLGWTPHGPPTAWTPQAKSIAFVEYGFPACDRATNQPNVFFDPKSSGSATPYWSIWDPIPGGGFAPRRDDTLADLALQAIYEYWNVDDRNETSAAGVVMVDFAFSCAWAWDARPFPTFPLFTSQWADAGDWATGSWLSGRGPALAPVAPSPAPAPGDYPTFPTLTTLGWSTQVRPRFATEVADHVSGRATRRPGRVEALYDVELSYPLLRADAVFSEMQAIAGFFAAVGGAAAPFWLAPPGLANVTGQILGVGDGTTTRFALARTIGGAIEPVAGTSGVTAVTLDGAPLPNPAWSLIGGYAPAIQLASAPAAGALVSADFGVLCLCRFADDGLDLEEFMAMLFALGTVKLQTARP